MVNQKNKIYRKRVDFVYPRILNGVKHFFINAKNNKTGGLYDHSACLVFLAFALESFVNFTGEKLFGHLWEENERKLKRSKRFKKILKELKINPDFKKRPYSTIKEVFDFRDNLAHAKIYKKERIAVENLVDDDLSSFELKTWWQDYCTEKRAVIAKKDIYTVMNEIFKKAKFKGTMLSPYGEFETCYTIKQCEQIER